MKLATLAILMTITLTAADGPETGWHPTPPIASAMRRAWVDTVSSFITGVEAGFRVDNRAGGETVVQTRITNQTMRQKLDIIPGVTVAIYHVHPQNADPMPSSADRRLADTWGVKIYTIHYAGLYMYDPATKKTEMLRHRLDWLRD